MLKWSQTCRDMNDDGWLHVLWTDEDNLALVTKYAKWFLPTYTKLRTEIERADAARFVYMLVFGGYAATLLSICDSGSC